MVLAHLPQSRHFYPMIRSELVARIARQNPRVYTKDVESLVNAIVSRIVDALAACDRVELRDFGAFAANEFGARTSRPPRTGKSVAVPAKWSVQFKSSKTMPSLLNLKPAAQELEAGHLWLAS